MKYILLFLLLYLVSCSSDSNDEKPLFLASSYPVYSILCEIAGDAIVVDYIVPTGASPHTYLPRPSDIKYASKALGLFYIAPNFDGWITKVPSKKKIKIIDMVSLDNIIFFSCNHDHSQDGSEHNHHDHEIDPHFWLDPLTVLQMIEPLTRAMAELYPEGKEEFIKNSEIFSKNLLKIDKNLTEILEPVRDMDVFLHHPSFNYMLERYGLWYGGAIEESPGKEPSPKFIAELVRKIKESGVKAIFSEPQLNGKNVKIIANEAAVEIYELNPEGNSESMRTYEDILIMNAKILRKALQ
ncbi:MAG: zinc ABC transporter substrate-binding protein [Candidatus Kapabacteria bacterium]|nr:zinc ABC transporter substrate-binding protein [Ignavibacteriota bacterium]MCW5885484.1 zinc ABC transporter substrate-binding protein [Candidatus Kapabacteria bacterium]